MKNESQSYKPIRCVNLDWVEVFAREPQNVALDAFFYQREGFEVRIREYGTRTYQEMFTLMDTHDEPLLEIRRAPFSVGLGGIFSGNECHIRLCNRTCYFNNAASLLLNFLTKYGYFDYRLYRLDICLDFVTFDRGDNPADFVRRYFKHRYAKINQGNIASHGSDTWTGQEWNSLSWGSKSSFVATKLYNKTMELYDSKLDRYRKPYIREAWFHCGMIDDISRVTKNGVPVNVWRVEFSMKSPERNWLRIELDGHEKKYQSLRHTLECYTSRDKILVMFASLAQHYFHFKYFQEGQRKDRCPDKILFDFSAMEIVYKLKKDGEALGSGESFKARYHRLIEKIKAYQGTKPDGEVWKACETIISALVEDDYRADLANPWSRDELQFFKTLLKLRTTDKSLTYDAAVNEVMKLLNITERTMRLF